MATKAAKQTIIDVPRIDIQRMQITLVGDTPLISHAWSEKAKAMMLGKQMKVAKQGKEPKDPVADFLDSLYWLTPRITADEYRDNGMPADARFGFPAVAFKASAVGACRYVDGVAMTEARGAFHVESEFIQLVGPEPRMREDMVRIGMGTADIRYRGEFSPWHAQLDITYNDAALSPAQIINLFNVAGFGVGVGEWRPSSKAGGNYGRFHVARDGEV